ncbi:hypothetical protein [Bdellovibrio sp. HCB337]|uniref:hypothetical protein n=1 Tax=Bdellovibrio sp. HCB337 TaxID=3394358 RepID=UPI0039A5A012
MRNWISTLFITLSALAAHAGAPGFSNGSQFSSAHIQGAVTVYCQGGDVITYTCYDTVLDPSSYDYFLGPGNIVADEVTLSNLRPDGTRRERTEVYDFRNARSDGAFNLWISTPFQRPLLALGKNVVDYLLLSRGKIVTQGTFTVNVSQSAGRTCPSTHYNSNDPNDCKSQYTVCQRYFEQYNYCR